MVVPVVWLAAVETPVRLRAMTAIANLDFIVLLHG
jgi:hypothetical protein